MQKFLSMGAMLDKLNAFLQSATQEQLDAKYEELSQFLSMGPLVVDYLETLPLIEFDSVDNNLEANPEYSLDFSFV